MIKIILFAITALIAIIILRNLNSEYALILSLLTCIFIFYMTLPKLEIVFMYLINITKNFSINQKYIEIIFKIIGISYICEFASQICADANQNSLATKIELSGKILIMFHSISILDDLLNLISNLI